MSAFGTRNSSALDRYITGNWGEDSIQEPYPQPRCEKCRAFLPFTPDRTEPYEDAVDCNGAVDDNGLSACGLTYASHPPHHAVFDCGTILYWVCRRCGHESKDAG